MTSKRENEDGLGLPDAKEIFRYGAQRFWSYTMVNGDGETIAKYAATKGLNLITYIDYPCFYPNNKYSFSTQNGMGWDGPEQFSIAFIERARRYGIKHNLFTK